MKKIRLPRQIVILVSCLLLGACAQLTSSVQEPRVYLVSTQFKEATLFEQRFLLTLRIQNPNDFPLKVRGLDFQVDINGENFAEGVSNQAVEVPAYGESLLDVGVSSSFISVFRQLKQMSETQQDGLSYSLHGRVSVEGRMMPITFQTAGKMGSGDSAQ